MRGRAARPAPGLAEIDAASGGSMSRHIAEGILGNIAAVSTTLATVAHCRTLSFTSGAAYSWKTRRRSRWRPTWAGLSSRPDPKRCIPHHAGSRNGGTSTLEIRRVRARFGQGHVATSGKRTSRRTRHAMRNAHLRCERLGPKVRCAAGKFGPRRSAGTPCMTHIRRQRSLISCRPDLVVSQKSGQLHQ